jgi:MPBQ/MSBQ methyltransferase
LEFDSLALDLFFCSEILKLPSLHYGLWAEPGAEALTLENLRAAQLRYTEALYRLVPPGTHSILDVGCGLGDVASKLAARGHAVTAISPDKNHGRYLKRVDSKVRFVQARYQSFESADRYDLVLMSESQNYFQPDVCFAQTARHLSANGHLLVSGMFRKKNAKSFPDFVNVLDEFVDHALCRGFEIIEDVDVTRQVLPTLELVHGALEAYVNPSLTLLERFMHATAPLKTRALTWLLRGQLGELLAIHRYLLAKTDPKAFAERATYRMMLFRKSALEAVA